MRRILRAHEPEEEWPGCENDRVSRSPERIPRRLQLLCAKVESTSMELVDCFPRINVDVDDNLRSGVLRNCSPPSSEGWAVEVGLEASVICCVTPMVLGPLRWARLESETKRVQKASERVNVLDDHVERAEPCPCHKGSLPIRDAHSNNQNVPFPVVK